MTKNFQKVKFKYEFSNAIVKYCAVASSRFTGWKRLKEFNILLLFFQWCLMRDLSWGPENQHRQQNTQLQLYKLQWMHLMEGQK